MLPRGVRMFGEPTACRQCVLPDPFIYSLVGSIGFEPTTPTMSRWCSNQLSYEPKKPRIIERVFRQHKPLRENFLNRCAGRLAVGVGAAKSGRCARVVASQQNVSVRCDVIHIALWITGSEASGFTVERLGIRGRGCESTKSCSVLHRDLRLLCGGLCVAVRALDSGG
ncbi:hypothetical protein BVI434_1720010 [Burkholderia vietnamiensis]|nr:hypothetical protein BVI434_1720010 [Burkholderia vietnamiensis]